MRKITWNRLYNGLWLYHYGALEHWLYYTFNDRAFRDRSRSTTSDPKTVSCAWIDQKRTPNQLTHPIEAV